MGLAARPDRHLFPTLPRRPIRAVLDGVTHLPNIGTMFRLCDAFRVERLYICGFDLEVRKRKLVRAASGTMAWVPWNSGEDAFDVVSASKQAGYSVAAVELAEDSVAPRALKTDTPVCIVLGGEREGVSRRVLALANECIEIPSDGLGGSINLATAAAIVMYEAARRFALT
jgi:23S rRNA (guanosine2251-2'-O)-methyltransferase